MIESLPEMRRHYLHSRYYFAVDIISAAPLELAALTAPSGEQYKIVTPCRSLKELNGAQLQDVKSTMI